jgi:hypothetical protein
VTAAAVSLVARLRQAGATLTHFSDGRVRFAAPAPLSADLLAEARSQRDAIAAALAAESAAPASSRAFSEAEREQGLVGVGNVGERLAATSPDAACAFVAARIEKRIAEALDGYEPPTLELEWPAQDEITAAYPRASLQRPPSWWRAEAHRPTPGAICACCGGQRWWSRDQLGWCCSVCHPFVTGTVVREVQS